MKQKLFKSVVGSGITLAMSIGFFSEAAAAEAPSYPKLTDPELISYVFGKAQRYSGIVPFPVTQMPTIYVVSKDEMNKVVCPEDPQNCRDLAALFDDIGYRILTRADFNFQANFDASFLIHEMVHALQYRARGAEIFKGCSAVYRTEEEAYAAQDRYLKDEGEFYRASIALRGFYCEERAAQADYEKSKAVWDERSRTHWFEKSRP